MGASGGKRVPGRINRECKGPGGRSMPGVLQNPGGQYGEGAVIKGEEIWAATRDQTVQGLGAVVRMLHFTQ